MPCDHLGGQEIIELAEAHLRAAGVPPGQWDGARFRHGENLVGGMWASVVIEIERRGEQWIVTRLDRLSEPIALSAAGLSVVDYASK